MNIVCSGCNFSNPYTYFSRSVGYYNVNVKLAGISAELDSKYELKGHGTNHGFSFILIFPIVYYPQSPPRIFGTSDELLFPRLLV